VAPGTHLALPGEDVSAYATEKPERRVLRRLLRGLKAVKSWSECWNIKINEGKTQAIYFCRRLSVPDDLLQLNGQNIPFVNNVTYLGATFDRRMTGRHHVEKTVSKALSTNLRIYSVFKSGRISTNIKLTFYKALIRSFMT
jgi:hypothetical protein